MKHGSLEGLYRPGTFLEFFHGAFDHELMAVQIPGMADASWDRKAAWLLWIARGNAPTPVDAAGDIAGPAPKSKPPVTVDIDDLLS